MFAGLIRFAPRNRTIADFYLTPYPLSMKWRGVHPEGIHPEGDKRGEVF